MMSQRKFRHWIRTAIAATVVYCAPNAEAQVGLPATRLPPTNAASANIHPRSRTDVRYYQALDDSPPAQNFPELANAPAAPRMSPAFPQANPTATYPGWVAPSFTAPGRVSPNDYWSMARQQGQLSSKPNNQPAGRAAVERLPAPTNNSNAPSTNSPQASPQNAASPNAQQPTATPVSLSQPPALPAGPQGIGEPRFAEQPKVGEHFPKPPPQVEPGMMLLDACPGDFAPDPIPSLYFDPAGELSPYDKKSAQFNPYPPVVLGRPFYGYGLFPPAATFLGKSNLLTPLFLASGDWRAAVASNDNGAAETNVAAMQLNLELDLKLTATERIHAGFAPLNKGNQFTRVEFNRNGAEFIEEANFNPLTGFFEGDLGAITGGAVGRVLPFDAPFAAGAMPLVYQNGVWFDDVVTGVAYTITARNSPWLHISNCDITLLTAWDGINSPAFAGDNGAAKMYGATAMIEAWGGYMETGYVFLEDRSVLHRSYHNIGWSWTKRYGNWLSNSMRIIGNVGQEPVGIQKTADGVLFILENSLITDKPSTFVPYFNLWAGLGRPQSVARNGIAGGVLVRSGILFETDGLTNYPTLDATAADSWGGAFGLNILPATFTHQLVAEVAYVNIMNREPFLRTSGNEIGAGVRYQKPLTNNLIFRFDAMMGLLSDRDDVSGIRVELRQKF